MTRRPPSGDRGDRRRARGWAWLCVLVLAGTVAAAALAPPASAHATVASSDPADGARLSRAPDQVSITFDESVGLDLGFLRVVDERGVDVTSAAAVHPGGRHQSISVALQPGLGEGTYLISWRVTSADSHPVGGSLRFVVGEAALATAQVPAAPVVATGTAVAFDVVRSAGYAGLALLGGGWLLLTAWPAGRGHRRARRVVVIGWGTAVVAAGAEFLVQGPYAAGRSLTALADVDLWADTGATRFGIAVGVRLLLLAGLGLWLDAVLSDAGPLPVAGRRRGRLVAVGTAFLAIAATYSSSGHAAVARPAWLAVASDMLHLAAAAVWLGGLVVLFVAVLADGSGGQDDDRTRAAVLPTFSRVASFCVVIIAVTGTYQGWRESGTVAALTTTTYGLLVLTKALLFAGLLLLGNMSRLAVDRAFRRSRNSDEDDAADGTTERGARGGELDVRRMRRSVLAEVLVAVAVLGVTGVLVAQPPGRAAAAAANDTSVSAGGSASGRVVLSGDRSLMVEMTPARHGHVAIDVVVTGQGPVITHLTMTATSQSAQLGPLPIGLRQLTPSTYRAEGVLLPAAGRWTLDVTAQFSQFDAVTAMTELDLT